MCVTIVVSLYYSVCADGDNLSSAAVTNIDTSGIIAFERLEKVLKRRNVQVILLNLYVMS